MKPPIKRSLKRGSNQTPGLLVELGFKPKDVYRIPDTNKGGFFARNAHRLYDVAEEAKTRFRQRLKFVHPDHGGSHEETARLLTVWGKLKRSFLRHGIALSLLLALPALAGKWMLLCDKNPETDIVQYQFFEITGSTTNLIGSSLTNGLPAFSVSNGPHTYFAVAVNSIGISSDPSTNLAVSFPQPPSGVKVK